MQLQTDLRAGFDFDAVRTAVRVGPDTEELAGEHTDFVSEGEAFLEGRGVAELREVPQGRTLVTVELRQGGELLTGRRVVFELEGDRLLIVTITADCTTVSCPGDDDSAEATECVGGSCVPPECSPDDPAACGEPRCASDGECAPLAGCTTPVCLDGECLREPRDDRCGEREYCDVNDGCTPRRGPEPDGGVDAGSPCVAGGCDDRIACTRDTCEADGCTHTPLEEGASCGPNGEVCESGLCVCKGSATETDCFDGIDNDCDGLVDCGEDPDCDGETAPQTAWEAASETPATCLCHHDPGSLPCDGTVGCGTCYWEGSEFVWCRKVSGVWQWRTSISDTDSSYCGGNDCQMWCCGGGGGAAAIQAYCIGETDTWSEGTSCSDWQTACPGAYDPSHCCP